MDLITAIKSGKRFRRPHQEWLSQQRFYDISREGILADDWEIEETKVEITESEFWKLAAEQIAVVMAENKVSFYSSVYIESEYLKQRMQKELLGAMAKKLFGKK